MRAARARPSPSADFRPDPAVRPGRAGGTGTPDDDSADATRRSGLSLMLRHDLYDWGCGRGSRWSFPDLPFQLRIGAVTVTTPARSASRRVVSVSVACPSSTAVK
ncbi:hypothetical protein GCM10009678_57200 [Actinomadura kijaniata]